MMKKKALSFNFVVLAALMWIFAPTSTVRADFLGVKVSALDNLVGGTFFDFKEGAMLYGAYTHAFNYKNLIYADIGAFADKENGTGAALGGISANLKGFVEILNLGYTIPKRVNLGAFYSYDFEDKKTRAGLYAGWEF